jgi:hypothetical protein
MCRSLEYKFRNGQWGGKAPLGYLNQRDANNKSSLGSVLNKDSSAA